jgi:hypothetical protein
MRQFLTLPLLWWWLLLSTTITITSVTSQSSGAFNEPPGERRDQTYRVLEFEDGTINQRYTGVMRYYCTFRGKWSEERHPRDFPNSPSFSQPVLTSHSNGYRMWTGTEAATLGVEALAEVSTLLCLGTLFRCFVHFRPYEARPVQFNSSQFSVVSAKLNSTHNILSFCLCTLGGLCDHYYKRIQ